MAAFLTGEKSAYDYLADSIEAFPYGAAMCKLIEAAGFDETRCLPLSGGIVSVYTAQRLAITAAAQQALARLP
jgi:demethylmenaquinone methyltransferase/2-methoxy-6-polyprenyl-1,4-benzoquinol methylase